MFLLHEFLQLIALHLRVISTTSSATPGMEENSCKTWSNLTAVTAAPLIEDNKTLLRAFPSVCPKPLSSGSTTSVASLNLSLPGVN